MAVHMEGVQVEGAGTIPVMALGGQGRRRRRGDHAAGMSNSEIAGMLGVDKSTVGRWFKDGEVLGHA